METGKNFRTIFLIVDEVEVIMTNKIKDSIIGIIVEVLYTIILLLLCAGISLIVGIGGF